MFLVPRLLSEHRDIVQYSATDNNYLLMRFKHQAPFIVWNGLDKAFIN